MNVGIDIEEVERFNKYLKKQDYLKRIFSSDEINYCLSKKNSTQHLAARFAAKEAVWKSLNSDKIIITDISIKNTKTGKPQVYINNKLCKNIDISLSHTKKYAVAVAISFSNEK